MIKPITPSKIGGFFRRSAAKAATNGDEILKIKPYEMSIMASRREPEKFYYAKTRGYVAKEELLDEFQKTAARHKPFEYRLWILTHKRVLIQSDDKKCLDTFLRKKVEAKLKLYKH